MSFNYIPRQLPSDHIVQRRFNAYRKANIFIKHFAKAKYLPNSIDNTDIKTPECRPKGSSLITETKMNYISPVSNLTYEIKHKIDIINNFNNISESKTLKTKKYRQTPSPKRLRNKILVKVNQNKYKELVNGMLKNSMQDNKKENTETRDTKVRTGCKSVEKINSTRASERCEKSKGGSSFLDSFFSPYGIVYNSSAKIRIREKKKIINISKDSQRLYSKILKKKDENFDDLRQFINISPLLDINKVHD